jgi:integrase/recombinase XerD
MSKRIIKANTYADSFFEMLVSEKGLQPLSLQAYQQDLKGWFKFLKKTPSEVTKEDIRTYLAYLNSTGLKPRSTARHLSTLRQYYHFLKREGLITHNPAHLIETPKLEKRLPRVLTYEDVAKLLKGAAAQSATFEGARLLLCLEFLYATGMRISELLSLRQAQLWDRNDTPYPKIFIRGKGDRERLVFITKRAEQALRKYISFLKERTRPSPDAYVFFSPRRKGHLTRQRLFQLLKELAVQNGIPADTISPHTIRHAFATHLLKGGADLITVQKLLGHQDISTTEVYTHLAYQDIEQEVQARHPLNHKKGS